MSDEEFGQAANKAGKLQEEITELTSHLKRAINNIRTCREACQTTSKSIEALNGTIKGF